MTGRKGIVDLATLRKARRGSNRTPGHGKGPTAQIGMRLDHELVARIDAVAAKLSRPGLALTRADALRIAIETGLEKIEREG